MKTGKSTSGGDWLYSLTRIGPQQSSGDRRCFRWRYSRKPIRAQTRQNGPGYCYFDNSTGFILTYVPCLAFFINYLVLSRSLAGFWIVTSRGRNQDGLIYQILVSKKVDKFHGFSGISI